jgi:hypothetical protein
MAAKSPARRKLASTAAAVERHHGPDDPRLPGLHRDLRCAQLEEHIRRIAAALPPLTDAQRLRLTALLTAPYAGGGGPRAA